MWISQHLSYLLSQIFRDFFSPSDFPIRKSLESRSAVHQLADDVIWKTGVAGRTQSFTEGWVSQTCPHEMPLSRAFLHTRAADFSLARTKDFEEQRARSKQMTSLTVTSWSTAESEPSGLRISNEVIQHECKTLVLSFVFAEVTLFQVCRRPREESLPSNVFV